MAKVSAASGSPDLSPDAPDRPWYKQVWVWFVIAIPASSVVTGIFLVVTAVKNADDLVIDDWYKEGRGTNRNMAAENIAAQFGIGMRATAISDGGTDIQFVASRDMVWPETMQLALRHRTLAAQDQELVLTHTGNGQYHTDSQLPAGNWHVRVSSDDVSWRLAGPATVSSSGELVLGAAH
ncbi:FixH family protein [Alcanivorax sp. 1008]|uniref:FixH family protein n=1 Tax=Alcanivorax sp. 1008 TaxID=2816853 RepID=UPI001DD95A0E|nr:FixH family protein [Alcanivorax sp. 1008]MCC1497757.1 FixH family protein [Alcanivorax sp. 1008]